MKPKTAIMKGICASAGMIALILDSKTALSGAAEGIDLCLKTVIPSLFPFFFLSALLTGSLLGGNTQVFRPLGKLCGIPTGAEGILIAGLIGGYPVGAQCISQAYATGLVQKSDARRMLGFCSNAGPAFLFGISGTIFNNKAVPFVLWMIHILSALTVGAILPGKSKNRICHNQVPLSQTGQSIHTSLRSMGLVCGWVIVFRILIVFARRWFLWLLPRDIQVFVTGCLELTNGYLSLIDIPSDYLRFTMASVFLALGGICVGLQTQSITGQAGLDTGLYFPGKLLQAVISMTLSLTASPFLFSDRYLNGWHWLPVLATGIVLAAGILEMLKKSSSIPNLSGV